MKHRVFVYGTLKRGGGLHGCLAAAKFIGEARTTDGWCLVSLGPYPGMVAGRGRVYGEVYEVDDRTLTRLDHVEGEGTLYHRQEVELDGGEVALAYIFADGRGGRPIVPGGRWMTGRQLYFAYGSNTNPDRMVRRCPSARVVGTATRRGLTVAFRGRGVADAVRAKGCVLSGVLWALDPEDVDHLDRCEGAPQSYRRSWITVTTEEGERVGAWIYRMPHARRPALPSRLYLETVADGYVRFGLPIDPLKAGVLRAGS